MDTIKKFQSIYILSFAMLVAYFLFDRLGLLYLCVFFIILPFLSAKIAENLQQYWLKFGAILGDINTAILLGFVFYAVLTPLAIIYRIFNKKAVEHFKKDNKDSLFEDTDSAYLKEDFKKLW